MKNLWLSEMYLDEKENCYKPIGWDVIETRGGFANIRHSVSFYKHTIGKKVILETDVSPETENELRALGLTELTRDFTKLKDKKSVEAKKVPTKDREVLDNLE